MEKHLKYQDIIYIKSYHDPNKHNITKTKNNKNVHKLNKIPEQKRYLKTDKDKIILAP